MNFIHDFFILSVFYIDLIESMKYLSFMPFVMLIFCEIYDYFKFIPELKKNEIAIKNGHDTIHPSFAENCCFFFTIYCRFMPLDGNLMPLFGN